MNISIIFERDLFRGMKIKPLNNIQDESIRIGVGQAKSLNLPLHFHLDHYELTFVEGGKGILLAGNQMLEFYGHEILLIPPGIPHSWISYKNRELISTEGFRFITIQFSLNYLTGDLLLRPEMVNIRRLFVAAEQVAILDNINDNSIATGLYNLKLESDFSTYIKILELLNRLGASRDLRKLMDESYTYRGNRKDIASVEKVFSHIFENYTRRIKISAPAGILGLNDTAFSHYFKKRTGLSFTEYLNQLRLIEADALVRYTNKKIARISSDCGFNNLSNFNRLYKNWKNINPAERRRMLQSSSGT